MRLRVFVAKYCVAMAKKLGALCVSAIWTRKRTFVVYRLLSNLGLTIVTKSSLVIVFVKPTKIDVEMLCNSTISMMVLLKMLRIH